MIEQSLFWVSTRKIWKYLQRYTHPCVHCSTIHGDQDMKTTELCFDRWFHKEDVVCLERSKMVEECVEVTLTSPRTNLELQLNFVEIIQNKQLNKSEREAL